MHREPSAGDKAIVVSSPATRRCSLFFSSPHHYRAADQNEQGEQSDASIYKGQFVCECYQPRFIFNHDSEVERALLRNGNVGGADLVAPLVNWGRCP